MEKLLRLHSLKTGDAIGELAMLAAICNSRRLILNEKPLTVAAARSGLRTYSSGLGREAWGLGGVGVFRPPR